MSKIASSICPICGNYMQDGVCFRCRANAATRDKKWRTGDHGGKRRDRTLVESPFPSRQKQLSQALNGTWKSLQREVTITINTRTRTYSSSHPKKGKETYHRFTLVKESGRSVSFLKDDMPIMVHVDDAGIVRMKAGEMELGFLYVHDGYSFRTCPRCFAKIPASHVCCDECNWSFGFSLG